MKVCRKIVFLFELPENMDSNLKFKMLNYVELISLMRFHFKLNTNI